MIPVPLPLELGCYLDGVDLMTCALDDLVAATGGEALFSVLVGGLVLLCFYIAGRGSTAVPTVMTLLLGSLMIPLLPGEYADMAYAVVALGIAFGAMAVAKRYMLPGGSY